MGRETGGNGHGDPVGGGDALRAALAVLAGYEDGLAALRAALERGDPGLDPRAPTLLAAQLESLHRGLLLVLGFGGHRGRMAEALAGLDAALLRQEARLRAAEAAGNAAQVDYLNQTLGETAIEPLLAEHNAITTVLWRMDNPDGVPMAGIGDDDEFAEEDGEPDDG